ncbi:SDR family NAD(P)-dependent oxidoreductase [Nonomuraea angiospora]|uniref:SDR family NAD(P)-dependent oxidoreductase n=1 Tax=Nonomuraea angiospora TaxID=46172 RepID=UPI0034377C29
MRTLTGSGALLIATMREQFYQAYARQPGPEHSRAYAIEWEVVTKQAAAITIRAKPLQEWDQMVDINLRGLMYVTKAALPHLLAAAQDSPRSVADVVNISSVAGRFAAPTVALYNATKFAVTGATEAWRQEYTTRNLRFSVIEPGRTSSELFDQKDNSAADFTAAFGQVEPLEAEDIADAVGYIVTSPRRVAVNEIVIRPTDQP